MKTFCGVWSHFPCCMKTRISVLCGHIFHVVWTDFACCVIRPSCFFKVLLCIWHFPVPTFGSCMTSVHLFLDTHIFYYVILPSYVTIWSLCSDVNSAFPCCYMLYYELYSLYMYKSVVPNPGYAYTQECVTGHLGIHKRKLDIRKEINNSNCSSSNKFCTYDGVQFMERLCQG